MKTIYIALVLSLMIFNSVSNVRAEESICDRLRRLKAQQPIFLDNSDENLLTVKKVKNPSAKESRQKTSPGVGAYYFLWKEDDSKVTIFNGHEYSLELSVPKYDWRPISVKWINPKLIHIDISFNPHYGAYWIYDVEEEKIIIHELENDGWDAWRQCSGSVGKVLEPDLSKSFATISGTSTIIGLLGEGWALQASLPSPKATLKSGSYPVDANLTRGPGLEKYIRPSAGPPTPPLPSDERYTVVPVKGLVVAVHDTVRAYGGSVILSFSVFEAGGARFLSLGPIKLPIKGPYP